MAKDSTATKKGAPAGSAKKPGGPAALAADALDRGDIPAARARLAEVAASGAEDEKREAQARLEGLSLDPRALLAAALVLLVILGAAFATLFRK